MEMDGVEWDGQGGMGWMEWNGMVESRMGMVGWENVGNIGNGLYRNMVYDTPHSQYACPCGEIIDKCFILFPEIYFMLQKYFHLPIITLTIF